LTWSDEQDKRIRSRPNRGISIAHHAFMITNGSRNNLVALAAGMTVFTCFASVARAGSRDGDGKGDGKSDDSARVVHGFAQVGIGLPEVAHAEAGVFLGSHLSLEAMVAWDGVYGGRYGGGLMYAIGHAGPNRPPRHAVLVGARLMLNDSATFDTHGDDASSYGVIPVGYGFLADSGFYLRVTAGLVIARERTTEQPVVGFPPEVGHELSVGGPIFNVSAGFAF
jgi:hypothetical protein